MVEIEKGGSVIFKDVVEVPRYLDVEASHVHPPNCPDTYAWQEGQSPVLVIIVGGVFVIVPSTSNMYSPVHR